MWQGIFFSFCETIVTSPAPKAKEACEAIIDAPIFSPETIFTWPNVPLWEFLISLRGSFKSDFCNKYLFVSIWKISSDKPKLATFIFPTKSFAISVKSAVFKAPIVIVISALKAVWVICPKLFIPLGISQAILNEFKLFKLFIKDTLSSSSSLFNPVPNKQSTTTSAWKIWFTKFTFIDFALFSCNFPISVFGSFTRYKLTSNLFWSNLAKEIPSAPLFPLPQTIKIELFFLNFFVI